MTVQATAWAMQETTGSASTKLVLIMIAEWVDLEGHGTVPFSWLCESCELTPDAALAALQSLGKLPGFDVIVEDEENIRVRLPIS